MSNAEMLELTVSGAERYRDFVEISADWPWGSGVDHRFPCFSADPTSITGCKQLVDLTHGEIRSSSATGDGGMFWIECPRGVFR